MTDKLYHDPDLVQFYDLDNGRRDDLEFCFRLAQATGSVLDLGCGTGELIARLADGRRTVGVDPATAMLEVARSRNANADWIEGDARDVRLDERFDLIVLTGHAFQVFLTDQDRSAVLATIARHLAPAGRFIFDTRNPLHDDWRTWTPDKSLRRFEHPNLGTIEAWNDVSRHPDTGIVTYQTHYRIVTTGMVLSAASSQLAFPSREHLARQITGAGLHVDIWYGDWHGRPWTTASPEIIPCGRAC